MKLLRGTIGYMIVGMLAMSVWDVFVGQYGIVGGFFAAFIIIGPMWFMNHYVGLIKNEEGHAVVDMGMGIALTGLFRDTFMKGVPALVDSLPTILLLMLGAIIGGLVAAAVEKNMEEEVK